VALNGVVSRWAEARASSLGSEVLALLLALAVSQHPDKHRPERPVLLAVDLQLGVVRGSFPNYAVAVIS
jgi:hypothetical protein